MRWLAGLVVFLAFATSASARTGSITQPREGTWKGAGTAPDALLTMRFVGGAYELRYAADTKGGSGSNTCVLKKGTLQLRLKALPNDAGGITPTCASPRSDRARRPT